MAYFQGANSINASVSGFVSPMKDASPNVQAVLQKIDDTLGDSTTGASATAAIFGVAASDYKLITGTLGTPLAAGNTLLQIDGSTVLAALADGLRTFTINSSGLQVGSSSAQLAYVTTNTGDTIGLVKVSGTTNSYAVLYTASGATQLEVYQASAGSIVLVTSQTIAEAGAVVNRIACTAEGVIVFKTAVNWHTWALNVATLVQVDAYPVSAMSTMSGPMIRFSDDLFLEGHGFHPPGTPDQHH